MHRDTVAHCAYFTETAQNPVCGGGLLVWWCWGTGYDRLGVGGWVEPCACRAVYVGL